MSLKAGPRLFRLPPDRVAHRALAFPFINGLACRRIARGFVFQPRGLIFFTNATILHTSSSLARTAGISDPRIPLRMVLNNSASEPP